jgi:hypothetical protein
VLTELVRFYREEWCEWAKTLCFDDFNIGPEQEIETDSSWVSFILPTPFDSLLTVDAV